MASTVIQRTELMGRRVGLDPRPQQARPPALEVAFVGHAPGGVRPERLRRTAREAMRRAGWADESSPELAERWASLAHLPIPIQSAAEFDDIFPEARQTQTRHRSVLAGERAWLPRAVDDFFANGGERAWIVRVPEDEGEGGFLPKVYTRLYDVTTLRGLSAALVVPQIGVIALPDLERIRIPPRLADIPRVRLPNPPPTFLPCGTRNEDDHRERRHSSELPGEFSVLPFRELVELLQGALASWRPDVQCLLGLPLAYSASEGRPTLDQRAVADVEAIIADEAGAGLKRIQFLFPYLRDPIYRLASPVGLIAGMQAGVARRQGVWRSIAGRAMVSQAKPYPTVSHARVADLRERPGVGVIEYRDSALVLDDERLCVPALHAGDYEGALGRARFDAYRTGEVARFMGYLIRELQTLGELLVFDATPGDPRPRFALEEFFQRLYALGALRGRTPVQAYRIQELTGPVGSLVYEIEVAPALPVDRIVLTFTNRDGEWIGELRDV